MAAENSPHSAHCTYCTALGFISVNLLLFSWTVCESGKTHTPELHYDTITVDAIKVKCNKGSVLCSKDCDKETIMKTKFKGTLTTSLDSKTFHILKNPIPKNMTAGEITILEL
jgi:hypothetical protein